MSVRTHGALLALAALLGGCLDVPPRFDPPERGVADVEPVDRAPAPEAGPLPDAGGVPVDAAAPPDTAVDATVDAASIGCLTPCGGEGQRAFTVDIDRLDAVAVRDDGTLVLGGATRDPGRIVGRDGGRLVPGALPPHGLDDGQAMLLQVSADLGRLEGLGLFDAAVTGPILGVATAPDGPGLTVVTAHGQGRPVGPVVRDDAGFVVSTFVDMPRNAVDMLARYSVLVPAADDYQTRPPWAIDGFGRLVAATGTPRGAVFGALRAWTPDGQPAAISGWRHHVDALGEPLYGPLVGLAPEGLYSRLPLVQGFDCVLRTWDDTPDAAERARRPSLDGNGHGRFGERPFDVFAGGPCTLPPTPGVVMGRGGPHGWRMRPGQALDVTAMVADPAGGLFVALQGLAEDPESNPDPVPTLVALDETGALAWWQRLHPETDPTDETTPIAALGRQEVLGLAVDPRPDAPGRLVVLGRTRVDSAPQLWPAVAETGDTGFQGPPARPNINSVGWLARLDIDTGQLVAVTHIYTPLAIFGPGRALSGRLGCFVDPAEPTAAQPSVPEPGLLAVGPNGEVAVAGRAFAVPTTADALVPLGDPDAIRPGATWSVRIYAADLSTVRYATALGLAAQPDGPAIEDGLDLTDMVFTPDGALVVVGTRADVEGDPPAVDVPPWGTPSWPGAQRDGTSRGFVARLVPDLECGGGRPD